MFLLNVFQVHYNSTTQNSIHNIVNIALTSFMPPPLIEPALSAAKVRTQLDNQND